MLAACTLGWLKARASTSNSPWVFPAAKDSNKPVGAGVVQHVLADNREALGVSKGFTSHSIRHAGLTWVAEQGGGLDIRNRLSAHHDSSSVDAHYQRSNLHKVAVEWWQQWGQHITALGSDDVVSIGA